jgi:hypothetical protein
MAKAGVEKLTFATLWAGHDRAEHDFRRVRTASRDRQKKFHPGPVQSHPFGRLELFIPVAGYEKKIPADTPVGPRCLCGGVPSCLQ